MGKRCVVPWMANQAITRALSSATAGLAAPQWPALGTCHWFMWAGWESVLAHRTRIRFGGIGTGSPVVVFVS
jgi:hypothetical protein